MLVELLALLWSWTVHDMLETPEKTWVSGKSRHLSLSLSLWLLLAQVLETFGFLGKY